MLNKSNIALLLIISSLSGCAGKIAPHPQDPYESMNRTIYSVNQKVDRYIYKPVAKTYDAVFPDPIKKGVSNFCDNIITVPTAANNLLQMKPFKATEASFRFVINTTIGIGGIFDPASYMGLKKQPHQDLGLTLAHMTGWKKSSYFVIPFIGPSTVRDTVGFIGDEWLLNPNIHLQLSVRDKVYILRGINKRYQLLDADALLDDAIDKYAMERDAYLQHRSSRMSQNEGQSAEDTYVE